MTTLDHLFILRRVGWVLIIVGTLDVAYMIYCFTNDLNYSSSFNIFAVVAGIYLLRGSLGASRLVAWFSAFYISAFSLAIIILFPQAQPLDYWVLTIKKEPLASLGSITFGAAVIGLLYWIYTQLRSPAILKARAAVGHKGAAPKSAFLLGALFVLGMSIMLNLTLKGETAERAIRLASNQYGDNHKYFVSRINRGGTYVHAWLMAYNDTEIKRIEVEWREN